MLTKCKFCGGGAYLLGTGALLGGSGARVTGGGAQIKGGGAGLRPNLTPAPPTPIRFSITGEMVSRGM